MLECQAKFITVDSPIYNKIYTDIIKSMEKIALVIVPVINGRCSYSWKQCILKYNNIYLNSNVVIENLNKIKVNNISCLVALCKSLTLLTNFITNLYHNTDVIELCSGDISIPKHKYDSILKCISYSDTLIIITRNNFIPKPIINVIPLAKAFNEKIFIFNL